MEELIIRLDTSPPEHIKKNAMVITTVQSPEKWVNKLGGRGQGIIGGLPIHELVKFKSGDLFRVTIQKLSRSKVFPPSPLEVLNQIHQILFFVDGEPTPNKPWSSEHLESIAEAIESLIPRPKPPE